ncbi:MAG: acetyl-CoA carboxylase biotin carboxyl carrier protein [Bacillota bacterium]|nr:acetyl-CoA carboxylase biotin carboxyl carrier protein [Bacillota bacterium]
MYSVDEVKELLSALDSSDVTKLELMSKDGDKLTLCKEPATIISAPAAQSAPVIVPVAAPVAAPAPASEAVKAAPIAAAPVGGIEIKAPMVGVFYLAPSPDSEPFVKVGKKVEKGEVVCIIEAMKLMNEITAETSGTIMEICCESGKIVEYGQVMFRMS